MIGYGRQSIDEDDIAAVVSVLRSDYLTQGPSVDAFEKQLCDYTGARFAITVNSGTAALYMAYAALGVTAGRRVWTSPITFVATVNAAIMLGATVEYVDVDPSTGNISIDILARQLERACLKNELPDVIVPVHLTGRSCDMAEIAELAKHYGFSVVEDAAHALGGQYQGKKIGSCEFSKATIFSFHPVKSITTGEGGVMMTNNPELAQIAREIRHHGITRDRTKFVSPSAPGFHYEQLRMGFNFRLSDIHAALGVSQMKKLDTFIQKRRNIASHYLDRAENLSQFSLPVRSNDSAWHLFSIGCKNRSVRDRLYANCLSRGITTAVHYPPVYRQPWHQKVAPHRSLAGAERYANTTLTLPLFYSMEEEMVNHVVQVLGTCTEVV